MAFWKVQEWRERTKKRLVDGFGGKCNKCGYDRYYGCLDIHHLDKNTKNFSFSDALKNPKPWDVMVDEARKCILLCRICHGELHGGIWSIEDIVIVPFGGQKTVYKADIPTGKCPVCGKDVFMANICCSRTCAGKRSFRVAWPQPDQLKRLVEETNCCNVARGFGVSEAAVRKRLKAYARVDQGTIHEDSQVQTL